MMTLLLAGRIAVHCAVPLAATWPPGRQGPPGGILLGRPDASVGFQKGGNIELPMCGLIVSDAVDFGALQARRA
jgi:hypothetical protein